MTEQRKARIIRLAEEAARCGFDRTGGAEDTCAMDAYEDYTANDDGDWEFMRLDGEEETRLYRAAYYAQFASLLAPAAPKEYRVTWQQCPHVHHTARVLFIEAASEADARAIATDHVERKFAIDWFTVRDVREAAQVPAGKVREAK